MKYQNKEFPFDFDNKSLKERTQIYVNYPGQSETSNIYHSSMARLGLAEIHKRQLEKSNRISTSIAIFALLLSVSSILIQYEITHKPQQIENRSLDNIEIELGTIISSNKSDSILFYLKAISKNNNQKSRSLKTN